MIALLVMNIMIIYEAKPHVIGPSKLLTVAAIKYYTYTIKKQQHQQQHQQKQQTTKITIIIIKLWHASLMRNKQQSKSVKEFPAFPSKPIAHL